ncbi:MAG: hypothetical protein ABFE08_01595 [Armatimonadia bacterium]
MALLTSSSDLLWLFDAPQMLLVAWLLIMSQQVPPHSEVDAVRAIEEMLPWVTLSLIALCMGIAVLELRRSRFHPYLLMSAVSLLPVFIGLPTVGAALIAICLLLGQSYEWKMYLSLGALEPDGNAALLAVPETKRAFQVGASAMTAAAGFAVIPVWVKVSAGATPVWLLVGEAVAATVISVAVLTTIWSGGMFDPLPIRRGQDRLVSWTLGKPL